MKSLLPTFVLSTALLGTSLLAGCAPSATPAPTAPAQMANPASVYCEKQGYRLEIRTAGDGSQTGYCIFKDGTECEEWAYYRGECKPGQKK